MPTISGLNLGLFSRLFYTTNGILNIHANKYCLLTIGHHSNYKLVKRILTQLIALLEPESVSFWTPCKLYNRLKYL